MVQTLNKGKIPQCPERRMYWYRELAFCELNNKYCLLDTDNKCVLYDDYLKEVECKPKVTGV